MDVNFIREIRQFHCLKRTAHVKKRTFHDLIEKEGLQFS